MCTVDIISESIHFLACAGLNSPSATASTCFAGISRSTTCAVAHMVVNRGVGAVEAIKTVKAKRDVNPSNEYLALLAKMENERRGEEGDPWPKDWEEFSRSDQFRAAASKVLDKNEG